MADGYERAYDMLMEWKYGFNHLDFLDSSRDGCGFWRRIFHEYFTQPWLSVGLTVVKELLILMWSASFVVVVSNPIWRIRVWGECLIHKYVGLLKGGYLTNTGLSLLDVSRGMIVGAQCMSYKHHQCYPCWDRLRPLSQRGKSFVWPFGSAFLRNSIESREINFNP